MPLLQPSWYCIRSHLKHEHIAAAHLRKISGVEVFNPQLRLLRSTRQGPALCTESLFPNYLFARFILERHLNKVRYTPTVKMVLQFGDRIPTIPDKVIEDLRLSLAPQSSVIFTDGPIAGEEVEIATGPFRGIKGAVTRVLPAKQRVQLLLEVMGRAVTTELSLQHVLYKHNPAAQLLRGTINPGALTGAARDCDCWVSCAAE